MSNNWNQQQPQSYGNGGRPRTGKLLSGGLHQQSPQPPYYQQGADQPPASMSPTQGPPQYSPLPPPSQQPQAGTSLRNWRNAHPLQSQQMQQAQQMQQNGWVSNTVDLMRRISGRMTAVKYGNVDPNPMVLYRPPTPKPGRPLPPKSKRWKRSRSVRVAMMMKRRRMRWQQARPKTGRIWASILLTFLLLLIIASSSSSAYAYNYYQSQLPYLSNLANQQISQTTRIYDRNWNLLYEVYDPSYQGGRRTPVAYKYIPKVMQDAQIDTEDSTFWTNPGFDPQAIARAATQQSGGASGITQQVIKQLSGNDQQTINRKISEATLAFGMTQQYPKWKILEMYFNISSYGAKELGVEAAVEDYFHLKPQCDHNFNCIPALNYLDRPNGLPTEKPDPILGLARASLLAGMPQNPISFDPTLGLRDSNGQLMYLVRQDEVLGQMLKFNATIDGLGPLTQDMINQAEALTAKMKFPAYKHDYPHGCQHFVQWVIQQLTAQLGDTLLTGGFNIRTTIDFRLEQYVERAVDQHLHKVEFQFFPPTYAKLTDPNYNVNDSAVVVMNAKTGEVLAMNGSANYKDTSKAVGGQVNAALSPRQPGSTWKPIVYATAMEQGWYPGMVLPDVKTYFPNGGNAPYAPTDYGNTYHNWSQGSLASMRNVLANSINIPAIKTLLYAGVDNVANTARRFGITALDDDLAQYNRIHGTHLTKVSQSIGPAFALGTMDVPLIQMTGAYQVFANGGVRIPPQSVLDIWDNYGHHLYHYDAAHPHGVRVLSPQIAFLMTTMLADEVARAPEFGSDHKLSFWDGNTPDPLYPDVAAKTGTTDSFKDNWTLGYTQDVVVGVWSGNADDTAMGYNVVGITGAAPIWHSVMERASGKCPQNLSNLYGDNIPCGNFNLGFGIQTFTPPPGVVQAPVSSVNGLQGSGITDWMLDGEQPQQPGTSSPPNPNQQGQGG